MPRLRQRDLTALSQALETLYADTIADTLPTRILASLRGVFDCDFATFGLMDLRRGIWHTSMLAPVVSDWPGVEVHQRHLHEDPAAAHIMRTRDPSAVKISDFIGLREYRALGLYSEVFGRVGCDRRLGVAVHDGKPVTLVATLNRKGRDFSDEDRTLLNLLRPHLLQANNQVYAARLAQVERERERTNLGEVFGAGLGEVDASSRLLWATARAETLLEEFFPAKGSTRSAGRLPDEMDRQLARTLRPRPLAATDDPSVPQRLVWQFAGPDQRRLKMRLSRGSAPGCWHFVLEETNAAEPGRALARALKLTLRQAEILYWLKQGKTNWEIGSILGIAEKTAGKHLEHIFAKLNVENRTAAVRVAIEAGAHL